MLSGELFIISTPVGNLEDLTLRSRKALDNAQVILAEDTRTTLKLLNHLCLKKRLISCHGFNERKRLALLDELAHKGATVALVCDAGTPLVSDPGFEIVQRAIALGMKVVPVPGPSAHLLALVASGLPCKRFAFEGFLPERKADRLGRLAELKVEKRTMIFYVAPHDLTHLLEELLLVLGNRPACLAREITKVHEEFLRGSLSLLSELVGKRQIRGECTLVVAGMPYVGEEKPDWTQVLEELSEQMSKGLRLKEASQAVATKYKVPKSKVYKLGLTLLKE